MPDADNARINTVASGVLVILVNVAAIKLITINGATKEEVGMNELKADVNACPNDAPFDSNGKITPPGNLPAEAKAIAKNFANPTFNATIPDA